MAHDVFISHSSKDKTVADATCAWLEGQGIRCWVAPRDIRPGANWGSSIIEAIRASRVMILIFSNHANTSPQIKREVERAVHFGIAIIPMRIEDVLPEGDLEYFLAVPHWLDVFNEPLENHLDALTNAVNGLLEIPTSAAKQGDVKTGPQRTGPFAKKLPPKPSRPGWMIGAAIVAAVLLLGGLGYYFGIAAPAEKARQDEIAKQEALQQEKEAEAKAAAAADAAAKARFDAEAQKMADAAAALRTQQEKDREAAAAEAERQANARGGLAVGTNPEGATIAIAGVDPQTSPATFKGVRLGSCPIHITLDGYEPVDQTAEIKENELTDLGTITLVRSKGSLQISSTPPDSNYTLSSDALGINQSGTCPDTIKDIPVGVYNVTLSRGDWQIKGTATVERAAITTYSSNFAYGSVEITSDPPGADVMQDGNEIGKTPLSLKNLKPGPVNYTLQLKGYDPAPVSGTITENQQLALSVTLAKEKPRGPKAGQAWTNSLGVKFVPAGTEGVWFSVWDVRVKDFKAFVDATGYDATQGMNSVGPDGWKQRGDSWKSPGFSQTDDCPVVGIDWNDAHAFCDWLTQKEQAAHLLASTQTYRLPTDAEWTRAVGLIESSEGTPASKNKKVKDVYPWGTQWPPPKGAGNYAGSEARDAKWPANEQTISGYNDGYPRTSPVGSFPPNRYGLYDMGGNVDEWCEDMFDNDHGWRVVRGAGWGENHRDFMLSSSRISGPAGVRIDGSGFRVVIAVSP
jgi:formylglycine-generating enzyme required for sulfatase activity